MRIITARNVVANRKPFDPDLAQARNARQRAKYWSAEVRAGRVQPEELTQWQIRAVMELWVDDWLSSPARIAKVARRGPTRTAIPPSPSECASRDS